MIYHIYANQSNIGDWLSALGIQKLLGNQPICECFCDQPFIKQTLDQLNNASEKDLIIIGGGGLLMDYFIPFWEAFEPFSRKLRFCIWGAGYCDIKMEASLPPAPLIEEILGRSRICIVRDELSRTHLKNLNLEKPVACPSLNYFEFSVPKGSDLLHVVNYTTVGEAAYTEMCRTGKDWAQQQKKVYRETNNIIQKGNKGQLDELLNRYALSDIALCSALHGCIIAAANGLKLVAVSGDRKIEGFMETVGLSDWVLNHDETEKIGGLLQNSVQQKNISSQVSKIKSENEIIARRVLGLLNGQ
jgi:polysaccharide pyruvyl transferase WcaK-like protein